MLERSERGTCLHAQVVLRLLETQILHDVGVVKIFEGLTLRLQCLDDRHLTRIVLVTGSTGNLDLFDSDHLTGRCVQGEIYTTKSTFADQLASDPFENSCMNISMALKVRK